MNNLSAFILEKKPLTVAKLAAGEREFMVQKLASYRDFLERNKPAKSHSTFEDWQEEHTRITEALGLLESPSSVEKLATVDVPLGEALTPEALAKLPKAKLVELYTEAVEKANLGRVGGRDGSQHTGVRKKS